MVRKISRLFVIKSRLEAFVIIYALALGASERGAHYLTDMPGCTQEISAAGTAGWNTHGITEVA